MNLKIAFTGVHGTGKSTLANIFSKELNLNIFGSLREDWQSFGIENFEILPRDVRGVFQLIMLKKAINKENKFWKNGFITERSTLDFIPYTVHSSNMSEEVFEIYEMLIFERLQKYDLIIYTPIEFEASNEKLRADVNSREVMDKILTKYLFNWVDKEKLLIVSGSVEERCNQIKKKLNYIKIK
jgi:deoxyadenosine/deoxycytidine kinase